MNRFSQDLQHLLREENAATPLTLANLLELSQERMFGILFVALSLPMVVPLPHFGLTLPVAVLILALALQMLLGHHLPWIPHHVLTYNIRQGWIQKVIRLGLPWLRRVERVAQPRLEVICTSLWGKVILGSAILSATVLMAIPLPGTNAPPALGILFVGVGLLEEDGLLSLMGAGICLGTAALAGVILMAIFVYGIDGEAVVSFITQVLIPVSQGLS